MDSSFTIKPRDSAVRTAVAGRGNSVRTDLSPSQSVNATPQGGTAHQSTSEPLMRDPSLDPQCQSLLAHEREEEELEERKRRKAREDEALMRQRAYGRKAEAAKPQNEETPHTDFAV